MLNSKRRAIARMTTVTVVGLIAGLSFLIVAEQAMAIPVFARKYRTSCVTCHAGFPKLNSQGEAFRRNGYQFALDDDLLVKDEPIPMGNEAYKDLWPNSIWPSDIPHLPPVSFRARLGFNQFLKTPGGTPSTDFRLPMDYSILSGGTFGENISWYAGMVLAGKGGHGGSGGGHGGEEGETGLEPELERLFVQFSNLFAWDQYDDDDGMRLGHRWISLPRHALNLRVGQFEPQVVAPWSSIHRQIGITPRLTNVATVGGNNSAFEPSQRGIELNGIIAQYNSYAVGIVNGNSSMTAWDNNLAKDFYFRVARKWWGYPIDGVLGEAPEDDEDGQDDDVAVRGQSPEDDDSSPPPGMDFWREISFETGVFGYFGRNTASLTEEEDVEVAVVGGGPNLELERMTTFMRPDDFQRIGFDSRLQFQDLDVFGACVWGWNDDPIGDHDPAEVESDNLFMWFLEADYVFLPWITGYCRYEQITFQDVHRQEDAAISRGVVGSVFAVRANMRVVTEFLVDGQNNGTTNDTFQALLDFSY